LGVHYGDLLGHRGFSHSLLFAFLWSVIVVSVEFRAIPRFSKSWWNIFIFFAAVTASHGVLDALTNGGLGVAFFSPFIQTRYFFPWRPVEVSPISPKGSFSPGAGSARLGEMR